MTEQIKQRVWHRASVASFTKKGKGTYRRSATMAAIEFCVCGRYMYLRTLHGMQRAVLQEVDEVALTKLGYPKGEFNVACTSDTGPVELRGVTFSSDPPACVGVPTWSTERASTPDPTPPPAPRNVRRESAARSQPARTRPRTASAPTAPARR